MLPGCWRRERTKDGSTLREDEKGVRFVADGRYNNILRVAGASNSREQSRLFPGGLACQTGMREKEKSEFKPLSLLPT